MGAVQKPPSVSREKEYQNKLRRALSSVSFNPDDRTISPRATEGDTTEEENFSEREDACSEPELDDKSQVSVAHLPQMGPMRTGRAALAAERQSMPSKDCSILPLQCIEELHKQVKLLQSSRHEHLEIIQCIRGDLEEAVGRIADMERALVNLERREPGVRQRRRTGRVLRSPQ